MKTGLIAESGGSKTDWCYVVNGLIQKRFTTESYHPDYWCVEFWERIHVFWQSKTELRETNVYFFGAGCFSAERSKILEEKFYFIGFKNVSVASDLHAAGWALYGRKKGWAAILGTGSVLFQWANGEVLQLIGGKGFREGDEGSGYYFGKLVYAAFLEGTLNSMQRAIFLEKIDVADLQKGMNSGNQRAAVASIAFQLREEGLHFESFHIENIDCFYTLHCNGLPISELGIVGSYGYFHRTIFTHYLSGKGISRLEFIERPIDRLVEQMVV